MNGCRSRRLFLRWQPSSRGRHRTSRRSSSRSVACLEPWAYFKASVAHSLAYEIGTQFSWSIESHSGEKLALFDRHEFFRRNASPQGYQIDSRRDRSDRRHVIDTLVRMLDGCRANLIHFTGGTQAANMAEQWQYRGFPPMTRVIEVRHCRPAPRPGFSTGPQDAGGHRISARPDACRQRPGQAGDERGARPAVVHGRLTVPQPRGPHNPLNEGDAARAGQRDTDPPSQVGRLGCDFSDSSAW